MNRLIGLVYLRQNQESILLAEGAQPVPAAALRTHEVQAEAVDVRIDFVGLELGSAADALPHAASLRLMERSNG